MTARQARVQEKLGVAVEVMIYGDGACCDPTTGIYELADPQPAVAHGGLNRFREGIKYITRRQYQKRAKVLPRWSECRSRGEPPGGGKPAGNNRGGWKMLSPAWLISSAAPPMRGRRWWW